MYDLYGMYKMQSWMMRYELEWGLHVEATAALAKLRFERREPSRCSESLEAKPFWMSFKTWLSYP